MAGAGTAGGAGDERIAVPPGVDITTPSVARGYDYALGGRHNYEVDRVAADALTQAFPGAIPLARDNRAMLRRGVRFPATSLTMATRGRRRPSRR